MLFYVLVAWFLAVCAVWLSARSAPVSERATVLVLVALFILALPLPALVFYAFVSVLPDLVVLLPHLPVVWSLP